MKQITVCLSAADYHQGSSCSTLIRVTWLRRSASPAIPMMFFTTASAVVFMPSAVRARSTSSSRLRRTSIKPQLRSTLRTVPAPDFLSPSEIHYLLLSPIVVRNKRRFGLTTSNNRPQPIRKDGRGSDNQSSFSFRHDCLLGGD